MDEKILWVDGGHQKIPNLDELNEEIQNGWKVKSCTAQIVSVGSNCSTKFGGFLIVLEKPNMNF